MKKAIFKTIIAVVMAFSIGGVASYAKPTRELTSLPMVMKKSTEKADLKILPIDVGKNHMMMTAMQTDATLVDAKYGLEKKKDAMNATYDPMVKFLIGAGANNYYAMNLKMMQKTKMANLYIDRHLLINSVNSNDMAASGNKAKATFTVNDVGKSILIDINTADPAMNSSIYS